MPQNKKAKLEPRKILLLGSGFVAEPALDYLLRRPENHITVGSGRLENAKKLAGKRKNVTAVQFDVKDEAKLEKLVSEHDIVISLIPWTFHVLVIKAAIKHKKNVVTTSYVNPFMAELNAEAEKAGISVLNEVGLDPGIDHFYALKTINEVHQAGGKILSFVSYCGGLPAPEASNNPLGYKFSWSPKGVLLALRSDAKFWEDGKIVEVAGKDLLKFAKPIYVYPAFSFEGYPNRDSTPYNVRYNIPEAKTILRGTLRYQNNPRLMRAFIDLGFLNDEPREYLKEGAPDMPWRTAFAKLLGISENDDEINAEVIKRCGITNDEEKHKIFYLLRWVGVLGSEPIPKVGTYLDALAKALQNKMTYQEDERDMVILQHKFHIENADGTKEVRTSTMLEYGEPNGVTAMARTVGVPCGIATQLILDGEITKKGVYAPYTPEIFEPIMKILEDEGIKVIEEVLP